MWLKEQVKINRRAQETFKETFSKIYTYKRQSLNKHTSSPRTLRAAGKGQEGQDLIGTKTRQASQGNEGQYEAGVSKELESQSRKLD